jgi:hypothetical protein
MDVIFMRWRARESDGSVYADEVLKWPNYSGPIPVVGDFVSIPLFPEDGTEWDGDTWETMEVSAREFMPHPHDPTLGPLAIVMQLGDDGLGEEG